MQGTIEISVVIPYYKRPDVIGATLESVFKQTYQPKEVIVVDDASGDDSSLVFGKYLDRIRLVTLEENGGVSNARNVGVYNSTGEYVAFLDSDDLWETDKLEKQVNYLKAHQDCKVVHTGCVNFFPDGREYSYLKKPARLSVSDLMKSSHVMYQSVLMEKDIFIGAGGFDPSFRQTEDYEFTMRLVTKGVNVDFLPEPLTRIRHGRDDKLSLNWKGFIKGHVAVVWRYHNEYKAVEGSLSVIKHTAKYIMKGGQKRGGVLGKLVYILGRIIWIPGIPAK